MDVQTNLDTEEKLKEKIDELRDRIRSIDRKIMLEESFIKEKKLYGQWKKNRENKIDIWRKERNEFGEEVLKLRKKLESFKPA